MCEIVKLILILFIVSIIYSIIELSFKNSNTTNNYMLKLSTTLFLLLGTFLAFSQVSETAKLENSNGEINGISKAVRNYETAGGARLQSILSLKRTLNDALNLTTGDSVLKKTAISPLVFNNYLKSLDSKYQDRLQAINKDNIDDLTQYTDINKLQKFYSKGISSTCLSISNSDEFVKMKDLEGEEIFAFDIDKLRPNTRYGLVDNYKQGFSRIKKDQVFGYLNLCGEEIIPCQYELAEPFNGGKAAVKKFSWYFVDVNGNESDELLNVTEMTALGNGISMAKFKNNKFGLIDNNYDVSKKPLSLYYDQIEAFESGENLFMVRNGKQFGIIKINGKPVLDISYDKVTPSIGGNWIIVERNKKTGLLDVNGTVRINPNFDGIETVFVNPVISTTLSPVIVKDETGFKIYELTNNRVSSSFSSLGIFNNFGLAKACAIRTGKTKCGYVNYEGSEVIPIAHDDLTDFSKYGMVVAKDRFENCTPYNGPCESDIIYGKDGKVIIDRSNPSNPRAFKYAITDTLFTNTLVIVRSIENLDKNSTVDAIHLLNKITKEVITENQPLLVIRRFGDDMISAMFETDKWGVIDYTGKPIVKPIYKEILHVSEGLFGVRYDNGKLGFIDKKGKVQIPFEYTEIRPFQNGLAVVAKNGKLGIITKFSAKIAPCVFKEINPVAGGNFELVDATNVKFLLNSNGDCQTNCAKFDDIRKKANN